MHDPEIQNSIHHFFTLSLDMLCIAGFDGYFKRLNPSWEQTLGYCNEELLSKPFIEFVHPDDRSATVAATKQLSQGKDVVYFENRYRAKDGSWRWLAWKSTMNVKEELIYATARDITDKKESENALRESEARLQAILDGSGAIIYLKGPEGKYLRVNQAYEEAFHVDRNDIIGKTDHDIFPLEIAEQFRQNDSKVLQSKAFHRFEEVAPNDDDSHTYITSKFPLFDKDDQIYAICGMSTDITERKQMERSLRSAKEAAETATRAKSTFLANMSHELRTPLNAIIGFSEMLGQQTFGSLNEKQSRYVDNINSSGKHLLELLNTILDLSKIEAGKMDLEITGFDVGETIKAVENIVGTLASKNEVNLSLEIPANLPEVKADHSKFKQVLYNLLSNAIKFTPQAGTVKVSAKVVRYAGRESIRVDVTDTGIGIRSGDQHRIFAGFEQVDSPYNRSNQGTGLGLAVSKKIVEMHHGKIWVESEGIPGEGSTFVFVIPTSQPERKKHSEKPLQQSARKKRGQVQRRDKTARNILVVEDDPYAREIIAQYLNEAGYQITYAEDGDQAIQVAKEQHPDLISLDILLPNKDGWQVLAELRSKPETKDIPVVVVSVTSERELGLSLGAEDIFVKPLTKRTFLKSLKTLTETEHKNPKALVAFNSKKTTE